MTGGIWQVCLSIFVIVSSVLTGVKVQAQGDDPGYVCDQQGITRKVVVVTEPGYACRVRYTRPSGTSYPWSARNDADYCQPKAVGLVKKLESLGWQCESAEIVHSLLLQQIERYDRYIKILANVGKACHFYPGEAQFGNLCGDARNEAAMVYTCDADDDGWDQYLAVFLEIESEPLIRDVGASEYRQVSSIYFADDQLVMEWERHDLGADQDAYGKTSLRCRYGDAGWELFGND